MAANYERSFQEKTKSGLIPICRVQNDCKFLGITFTPTPSELGEQFTWLTPLDSELGGIPCLW